MVSYSACPKNILLASTALASIFIGVETSCAQTLPRGGTIAFGSVGFSHNSGTLTIHQSSQSAIANYNSFSIKRGHTVNIRQPNGQSVFLGRVTGRAKSTIAGRLDANGQFYLINPNGIAVTRSGVVNVGGGFVASSLQLTDKEFRNGGHKFRAKGHNALVTNAGTISIGSGGYAALIGGRVRNSGSIAVPLGRIALGSGNAATLDVSGDQFLQIVVPSRARGKGALLRDTGSLDAEGGTVVLDALTARGAARGAVAMSGSIDAHTVGGRSGSVIIGGGSGTVRASRGTISVAGGQLGQGGSVLVSARRVRLANTIDASGRDGGTIQVFGSKRANLHGGLLAAGVNGHGGEIDVTGKKVAFKASAVDARGANGGGDVNIGGNQHGAGALPHATTVQIDRKTLINVDATSQGDGGNVVVWSDGRTTFAGLISAQGSNLGHGGWVETSGHTLSVDGSIVNAGKAGHWLLDPYDLTIGEAGATSINTALGAGTDVALQTTASGTSGPGVATSGNGDIVVNSPINWSTPATLTLSAYRNIALNADITASAGGSLSMTTGTGGTGDYAIAQGSSISFTGAPSAGSMLSINGQNYSLIYDAAGLQSINTSTGALAGHYALATSIDAAAATAWVPLGTDGNGTVNNSGAGFAGVFTGLGHSISNLTFNAPNASYAGLFGYSSGVLRDLGVANTSISGNNFVGSLVGYNVGVVANAHTTSGVYPSTVIGLNNVGGLVGENDGSITNSSAVVQLTSNAGQDVGGLVGHNIGNIADSFTAGVILDDSGYEIGGLAGYNSGLISNAYATSAVTGLSTRALGGLIGYNKGIVTNVFASGYVGEEYINFGTEGGSGAGLIGNNQGTVSNGYWNVDTSGRLNAVGAGTNANGTTGLSATSGPSPYEASSYAGFDFTSGGQWNIVSGLSLPYLQYQFPTGVPQVISGSAARAPVIAPSTNPFHQYLSGVVIGTLVDGNPTGLTTVGYNGFYSLLIAPNSIAPTGSQVLAYITGRVPQYPALPPPADSFYDNATGSISGLNIYGHYVTLYSGASNVTSIAKDLSVALGSQTGDTFQFTVGGGPDYRLALKPDPFGLPSVSQLLIVSSAQQFDLDQVPTLPTTAANLMLITTQSGASVTQSAPILGGGRLSILGAPGSSFTLTNSANDFSIFAGNAGSIELSDKSALTIGSVNLIPGVTADTFTLKDSSGAKQSQAINASNVLFTGAATFAMTNSANSITTFAANANSVKLADSAPLSIGTVRNVAGVTTSSLLSISDAASVTQSAEIKTRSLLLSGPGAFSLSNGSNSFSVLASNAGSVNATDGKALSIGEVAGLKGIETSTVELTDPVAVSQTQPILVNNFQISGGSFILNNTANQIRNIAGNVRVLKLQDSESIDIGSVGAISGLTSFGQVNIGTTGNGSDIIISESAAAGGLVTLTSAGAIHEVGSGQVSASALSASSTTGTQMNGANSVNTLTAMSNSQTGDLSFVNSKALAVTGVIKEDVGSGALSLQTGSGNITIAKTGVLRSSTVNLLANAAAREASAAVIAASTLNVTAGSGIQLVGNNNIGTVGIDETGSGPNVIKR